VVWSWVFNGFRPATELLLLPLVLRKLSTEELGMYYGWGEGAIFLLQSLTLPQGKISSLP
jgi:hypothetical protein